MEYERREEGVFRSMKEERSECLGVCKMQGREERLWKDLSRRIL